ncbi:hypothetical protein KXQ82_04145 [Mucilaginibacter sp. HMF5004]|uniref:hypothetical protein n=1 Tax=Mucilaginibacter rivuli TaxID=2857527 RepID=UPI001C5FBE43|nr:hypothetical protein [Mucilaginibacter rivuli]MBW4888887.1 hypothetical protein [Mucilaginibacter rivuli]
MNKLFKTLALTCTLPLLCFTAKSQTVSVADLIRLTVLSHKEAAQFISTQRHFKVLKPVVTNGITISQYSKEGDFNSELIVKNEFQDKKGIMRPSINYDFKPAMYVNTIISQLKALGFTLTSKQSDAMKQVWIYDNGRYLVSIHAFGEALLPANVEIHGK